MRTLLKFCCAAGLALTVIPPCLRFSGTINATLLNQLMFAGTILWFVGAAALGMKTEPKS